MTKHQNNRKRNKRNQHVAKYLAAKENKAARGEGGASIRKLLGNATTLQRSNGSSGENNENDSENMARNIRAA